MALDAGAWHALLFSLNASLIATLDAHSVAQPSQATAADFLAQAPK